MRILCNNRETRNNTYLPCTSRRRGGGTIACGTQAHATRDATLGSMQRLNAWISENMTLLSMDEGISTLQLLKYQFVWFFRDT